MPEAQIKVRPSSLILLLIFLLFWPAKGAAQQHATYTNPVVAGDYPDPSIIRVGQDYWATTTSGPWEPEFPILHSRDLINWEVVGAVFKRRPAWAVSDFWAPEISMDQGRFFVYYTARKKGGILCVAVATSINPLGPYTDHGPLICQEDGSIDPAPVTDEQGERYLVWKEDGNSRNQPTPIWTQKLSKDGTKLVGGKKELMRNDPKSWEGGVVEGAFILRRGEWFYLFYSGNACCGRRCNYALGVARSRKLLGPWEKNPANPILAENQVWQCPGHGSIVSDDHGRDFLLYHAYKNSEQAFYLGREALLDEIIWDSSGWPSINQGRGPSRQAPAPLSNIERRADYSFYDEFNSTTLKPGWQWRQGNEPTLRLETENGGRLVLSSSAAQGAAAANALGAVLSQPAPSANYVATTSIKRSEMSSGAIAGLAAYGGPDEALGIAEGEGKIFIYMREGKQQQIIKTVNALTTPALYLRMSVTEGSNYRFAISSDGTQWSELGQEINGSFLEGARPSLTVGGIKGGSAKFEWIRITPS